MKYGVVVIAGSGNAGSVDGVGIRAGLDYVNGICICGDSLVMAESKTHRIRRLLFPTAETRKTLLPALTAVLARSGWTVTRLFELITDYAVSEGM